MDDPCYGGDGDDPGVDGGDAAGVDDGDGPGVDDYPEKTVD